MKKKMILVTSTILMMISTACEKEVQFTPVEGTYTGKMYLQCDSIGLDKTYNIDIWIASNGEELLISNTFCTGNAYPSRNTYHYGRMQWVDIGDCGQLLSFDFRGGGILEGDSLKENGQFIVYKSNKKFNGTWRTRNVQVSAH